MGWARDRVQAIYLFQVFYEKITKKYFFLQKHTENLVYADCGTNVRWLWGGRLWNFAHVFTKEWTMDFEKVIHIFQDIIDKNTEKYIFRNR